MKKTITLLYVFFFLFTGIAFGDSTFVESKSEDSSIALTNLEWISANTCSCKKQTCPDGGVIDGCSISCPFNETPSCDCGDCNGVKVSRCICL